MKVKKFTRFEDYLEHFGETASTYLKSKGNTQIAAEHKTRELIDILRQARWMRMRANIKAGVEEEQKRK